MSLLLNFFGTFQAKLEEQPIPHFRSVNGQGLLVYLALQAERPFSRESLATLFWPYDNEASGKKNLRQTLYQVRQLIPDGDPKQPYFLTTRQTIQFNGESDCVLDVNQFVNGIATGDLETAVSQYSGELLSGFTCDSLDFEAWLRQERERLHRLALKTMSDLTERHLAQANWDTAQAIARKQLSFEPWHETAHRQLIQALAQAGDRHAASAQYKQCQQILQEELGASPNFETIALMERIQSNQLTAPSTNLIANTYELGKQIGQGAMGIVYKGKHHRSGEFVAIKMLDRSRVASNPELLERFEREGDALRQLNHPNIVTMHAMAQKDGRHYLIMEYVEGGDLKSLIQKEKQIPLQHALSIGLDLADALTRTHRLHILHRDIKAANVLIGSDGTPRLTDFGIARLDGGSELTQSGAIMGTLAYLSPEACQGLPLDERSDIWAFGILLYEMLAGRRPFEASNLPATITAILSTPLPDIRQLRPNVPPALADLLAQILTKDLERRIPSIRLVGAALEAFLAESGTMTQSTHSGWITSITRPLTPTKPLSFAAEEIELTPSVPKTAQLAPFQAAATPIHFVGRTAVFEQLRNLLTSEDGRIVALVGMGGIGKTSLAAHAAQQMRPGFLNGVLWGNVYTSEVLNILGAWARAYGYDFSGLTDIDSRATAVRGMLADKQTLIVLDNVEDAATVRPLLPNNKQCATLITTRNLDAAAALNAHIVPLNELTPESSLDMLKEILGTDRVEAEADAADQIGHLLHHLPLAVEIAAQRLKSRQRMSLAAMADRLQNTQQRLGLAISDQAVRASFQVSWEGLDSDLKLTFVGMAVFAGRPFTPEALSAVLDKDTFDTEDNLYTLNTLSLVNETGQSHYKQHPLLADFAAEQLQDKRFEQHLMLAELATEQLGKMRLEMNGRYIRYYLKFSQEHNEDFDALEPEWENISAAIELAHGTEAWQTVLDFTNALAESWFRYGRFYEANRGYFLAKAAAKELESDLELAKTLLRWGEIGIEQSQYDQAWQQLETSLKLYYQEEDEIGVAIAYYFQGYVLYDKGQFKEAQPLLIKSHDILKSSDRRLEEARTTIMLARVTLELSSTFDEAEKLAHQAMNCLDGVPEGQELISILLFLSLIEIRKRNLSEAESYAQRALTITQKLTLPLYTGWVAQLLVHTYRLQEKHSLSEQFGIEGVEIFQKLGNKRWESILKQELGRTYIAMKKYQEAKELSEQILQIYRSLEDRLSYGHALLQLGEIHQHLNQPEKAQEYWQEATELAEFLENAHLLEQIKQRTSPPNNHSFTNGA